MAQFSLCIRTIYPEATSSKVIRERLKPKSAGHVSNLASRIPYAITQYFALWSEQHDPPMFMKVRILSVFYLQTKDNGMARRSVIYRAVITE